MLVKLRGFADQLAAEGKVSEDVANTVRSRAEKLLSIIEPKPKTRKWVSRSKNRHF